MRRDALLQRTLLRTLIVIAGVSLAAGLFPPVSHGAGTATGICQVWNGREYVFQPCGSSPSEPSGSGQKIQEKKEGDADPLTLRSCKECSDARTRCLMACDRSFGPECVVRCSQEYRCVMGDDCY